MVRRVSCLLLAWSVTANAPLAAQRVYRLELSGGGSYNVYDSQTELGNAFGGTLRLGYWIYGPLSLEIEGTYAKPRTDTPLKASVNATTLGGWLLGNLPLSNSSSFFVKGGWAHTSYGSCPSVSVPGSGPCGDAGVIQGGAGFRIGLTPAIFMRYEGMVNRSLTTLKFSNVQVQGGLSVMIGSKPLIDADKDGVYDRYDRCPGTRLGALVNKSGCPTDLDNDGVPDGLDRCPNTVAGATVDEAGCSHDSDEDGVLDGLDQCPDTPQGALVDDHGCPSDEDHDGVFDGLDRCPMTPAGATVDPLGCPGDADGDGVLDGLDRCPETRAGAKVDAQGCPTEPEPPPAPATQTWVVPGAVWQLRGAKLDPSAHPVLDSVVAALQADPRAKAEIDGYAQDRLVPVDNTRLSQRRAEVVRAYILSRGISVIRVTAVGRGSETLLVNDTTAAARTTNRRVEIHVTHSP
jgi:hypothetical protein